MSDAIRITGDQQLIRKLGSFPVAVQRKIARKAIRPAASMVSKAMKKNSPKLTVEEAGVLLNRSNPTPQDSKDLSAHIRKGIGRKTKTYTKGSVSIEAVGPRWDYRQDKIEGPAAWYAQRVEHGDGGDIRAHGFIRRTASETGQTAVGMMLARARELVIEEATRGGA
jgi:HK97 gp10 family phage protein